MVRIIALVCVVCGCGGGGGEDMPDAAVSPDSKQETCSFVDDFTGTLLRPDWRLNVYGPQLNVTVQDALRIDVPANVTDDSEAGIQWIDPRPIDVGTTVDVEVVQATTSPSGYVKTYLDVEKDFGNHFLMYVNGSTLEIARIQVDTTIVYVQKPYDAVMHRWWRFEHGPTETDVTFSTSPDGTTWHNEKTAPAFLPMPPVQVGLKVGSYQGGGPVPTRAIFDNLRVCTH